MKHLTKYLFVLTLILLSSCSSNDSGIVMSPDRKIQLQVELENGQIYYAVTKDNKPILNKSLLGFILKDSELNKGFKTTVVR